MKAKNNEFERMISRYKGDGPYLHDGDRAIIDADQLRLDPVYWGYGPEWWDKQPLINARGETAASGRMFKPLWNHGRAIVPADGWFEWKKEVGKKQPY